MNREIERAINEEAQRYYESLHKQQMNREIEFRGKRIDNGEWVYGSLIDNLFFKKGTKEAFCYIIDSNKMEYDSWEDIAELIEDYEVIPETVGMGVVIEDKRFFEGDRVVCSIIHSDTGKRFDDIEGVIKFDSNTASFIIENINNMRGFYFLHSAIINTIKVIGTIHDDKVKEQK